MTDFLKHIQTELNEVCSKLYNNIDTQEQVEAYDRIALLTQEIEIEIEIERGK